jgi:RimJ/RimL family protein N-acetyltransferase
MKAAPTLVAPRVLLRPWRDDDLPAFAAINADAQVMAHYPSTLDRAVSDALEGRIRAHFDRHGFGLWAVEIPGVVRFAGYVGLAIPTFEAPFMPSVEVGWRLAVAQWGRGYATEAAGAALDYGFDSLGLSEIVSFTVPANERSWRVMERLGMARSPADDFDYPNLPVGHKLRRHIFYRIKRIDWTARHRQSGK